MGGVVLFFIQSFLRDHFSGQTQYFLIDRLIYLEKLCTFWHQTPPLSFRWFGERGQIFTDVKELLKTKEFQIYSNVTKAIFLLSKCRKFLTLLCSMAHLLFLVLKKKTVLAQTDPLFTHARCLRRLYCDRQRTCSSTEHITGCRSEDDRKLTVKMTESVSYHVHAMSSTLAESRSLIISMTQRETPSRLSSFQILI